MTQVALDEPGAEPPEAPVVRSLSPSRAADFTTCPLAYRFKTIDRLPERPSAAAVRGTVLHAALERLYDLPPELRSRGSGRELVDAQWQRLREEVPELGELFADDADGAAQAAWLASARDLLDRYFDLEDPTRLEPAQREAAVETVLGSGLRLRGVIDRVDVAADGAVRIVDYKSGTAPQPGSEGRAMFQLRFYALVLWRSTGQLPRVLQLIYLGGGGERLEYSPDEADLLFTERKAQAVWEAIERATADGDWQPSPSWLCEGCSFRSLCPAFGGTPPPLPPAADAEPASFTGRSPLPATDDDTGTAVGLASRP